MAREIDALIEAGDVAAAEAWFEANRDRRVRAADAARLFAFFREASPEPRRS
jgi:hypothetical protein